MNTVKDKLSTPRTTEIFLSPCFAVLPTAKNIPTINIEFLSMKTDKTSWKLVLAVLRRFLLRCVCAYVRVHRCLCASYIKWENTREIVNSSNLCSLYFITVVAGMTRFAKNVGKMFRGKLCVAVDHSQPRFATDT